jgi:ribose transport system permease protein
MDIRHSGFTGGSSLDVGSEYLLTSIAVVVIGGTSVVGGMANILGLWGGALRLFMIGTLSNESGLGIGVRVITVAGRKRKARNG